MNQGQEMFRRRVIAARSRVGFGCAPSGHVEVTVPAGWGCGLGFEVGEAALTAHEAVHVGFGRSSRSKVVDAKAGGHDVVLARGDFSEE